MPPKETHNHLLLPIHIEALLTGKTAPNSEWVNLKPDFRSVYENAFLGQQLEVEPCGDTVPDLYATPGIHLHWALPDGLTHGIVADQAELPEFPPIPNRWLIVRSRPRETSTRQHKAWIIESDTITDDRQGTVWPHLRTNHPDPNRESDYHVFVGRRFELHQWPGETGAPAIDITAVGYGDPSFTAYYPAGKGILGFHDRTVADLKDVSLAYFVAGWYADPFKDPLHRAQSKRNVDNLAAFFEERRWTYPGLEALLNNFKKKQQCKEDLQDARQMMKRLEQHRPDTQSSDARAALQKEIDRLETRSRKLTDKRRRLHQKMPNQLLCHGTITDIQWRSKDHTYDTGLPRGKPFSIAMGNSMAEALTALFKENALLDNRLATLIEAFQYDLLKTIEQPGGLEILHHKLHKRGFRPQTHGVRWKLIQAEDRKGPLTDGEKQPPIPGDIQQQLETLNRRQAHINQLKRQRRGVQSQLYAAWYKSALNAREQRIPPEDLTQQIAQLKKRIDELNTAVNGAVHRRTGRPKGQEWNRLNKALDTFLPGWRIEVQDEARFWRPNDPVVLISGEPFKSSRRHGGDGRYQPDEKLLCRLVGQAATGIRMIDDTDESNTLVWGNGDLDRFCPPLNIDDTAPIPSAVIDLLRESFLLSLDETSASQVAKAISAKAGPKMAVFTRNIPQLTQMLLQLLSKSATEAETPQIDLPDGTISHCGDGTPGVSIQWTGAFPSPPALQRWEKNPWLPLFLQWRVGWTPDPQKNSTQSQETTTRYSGTTMISPDAVSHFSQRLGQYNLTHDLPALKNLQTAVNNMNVLGQTLSGFTDQLLARKALLELHPLEPGRDGFGPQPSSVFNKVADIDWLSPLTDKPLFPMRSGCLRLEKLWIVDAFGQVLKLDHEDRTKVDRPIVPKGRRNRDGAFQMPAGLNQPARLTMQWPSSEGGTDALCGWILPNFLDGGLMIYDARGNALGALQAVRRKSWSQGAGATRAPIESFHWLDIPGSDTFFFGLPPEARPDPLGENADPDLRGFINGLLALSAGSGAAFGRLIDTMNDALSTVGTNANPNLALLIGKPLALVRASIHLELYGPSARVQGWEPYPTNPTAGIEQIQFPLQLGDRRQWRDTWLGEDGLVGFFLNQNYSRCHAAAGLPGRNDDYNRYGTTPSIAINHPINLTLLMSPSRGVCVTSDILPRKLFHLPQDDIDEILENKQVIFFTGPVVGPTDEVRMPKPSDIYGQWAWTHHPAVEVWEETPLGAHRDEQGQFFEASQISDGWLKLMTAPLKIHRFTVNGKSAVPKTPSPDPEKKMPDNKPEQFIVTPGETLVLTWSVMGADSIQLQMGDDILFISQRHPLPTQYCLRVDKDAVFTLAITGRQETTANNKTHGENHKVKSIEIVTKQE